MIDSALVAMWERVAALKTTGVVRDSAAGKP
jgi:hypothetical protein